MNEHGDGGNSGADLAHAEEFLQGIERHLADPGIALQPRPVRDIMLAMAVAVLLNLQVIDAQGKTGLSFSEAVKSRLQAVTQARRTSPHKPGRAPYLK